MKLDVLGAELLVLFQAFFYRHVPALKAEVRLLVLRAGLTAAVPDYVLFLGDVDDLAHVRVAARGHDDVADFVFHVSSCSFCSRLCSSRAHLAQRSMAGSQS